MDNVTTYINRLHEVTDAARMNATEDAYEAYKNGLDEGYLDGYEYGYNRPIDTGYSICDVVYSHRSRLVNRINNIVRIERRDAYNSGLEHAETLFRRYRTDRVVAVIGV